MRVKQEKITYPVQSSFKVLKYTVPFFDMPFHYHAEYELVYISHGSGVRYIGDSIHKFQNGDMVFIGPELAHIWITPEKYRQEKPIEQVEAIVLQFSQDLFKSMIDTPEFQQVKKLLNFAQAGLKVTGTTRVETAKLLEDMLDSEGISRFSHLLNVVDLLSKTTNLILLNEPDSIQQMNRADKRINAVHHFVKTCYNQRISSRDAAAIATMEQAAFCRFFKLKTQKTFTQFLNETRIDQACRLLLEKKQSIVQIAYESGFRNMTHFYKQFKRYTGTTPLEFRKS